MVYPSDLKTHSCYVPTIPCKSISYEYDDSSFFRMSIHYIGHLFAIYAHILMVSEGGVRADKRDVGGHF